jgi:hypothetical protein
MSDQNNEPGETSTVSNANRNSRENLQIEDFYDPNSVSYTGTPNLQRLQRTRTLHSNKKRLTRIARSKRRIADNLNQSNETYPTINLREKEPNILFPNNKLVTTKYTLLNFIPKNVFEQFRRVTNVYFLLIAVVSFIPQISPISPYTTVMGLVFVLAIAALNDGYLDFVSDVNKFSN